MKFVLNFYKISIVLSEITHFKINFCTFGRLFVTLASLYMWINWTNLNSRVWPRDFSSSLVSSSFSGRSKYMSVSSQPKWYKSDGWFRRQNKLVGLIIHFQNVQWSTMLTSNLCIRFSTIRSLMFEMKALHNQHSHVGHSNLIYGLTQIRYVGLNCFKRLSVHVLKWKLKHGTWKLQHLNWA